MTIALVEPFTSVVEPDVGGKAVDDRRDEVRSTGRKVELVLVEADDCCLGIKLEGPAGASRVTS